MKCGLGQKDVSMLLASEDSRWCEYFTVVILKIADYGIIGLAKSNKYNDLMKLNNNVYLGPSPADPR